MQCAGHVLASRVRYMPTSACFPTHGCLQLRVLYMNVSIRHHTIKPSKMVLEHSAEYAASCWAVTKQSWGSNRVAMTCTSRADGDAELTESLVVVEYLDAKYGGDKPLLPQDPLQRAKVRLQLGQLRANSTLLSPPHACCCSCVEFLALSPAAATRHVCTPVALPWLACWKKLKYTPCLFCSAGDQANRTTQLKDI